MRRAFITAQGKTTSNGRSAAVSESRKLTHRQRQIRGYIRDFIATNRYPPTFREIGKHFGIKSTNGVNDHLVLMEKKGALTWQRGKSRTIRLLPLRGRFQ